MTSHRRISLFELDFSPPPHPWPRNRHSLYLTKRPQPSHPPLDNVGETVVPPPGPNSVTTPVGSSAATGSSGAIILPPPESGTFKISKSEDYNKWKKTYGRSMILSPIDPTASSVGDLRIHEHDDGVQFWLFQKVLGSFPQRMEWVVAKPGHGHPTQSNYVLHIKEKGDPSWVLRATGQSYRRRRDRENAQPYSRASPRNRDPRQLESQDRENAV